MHKQHRTGYSIDGFTPRPSNARPIGFDMSQARRPQNRLRPLSLPPVQPKKPGDSFPGVGMTLSTYSPTAAASPSNMTSTVGVGTPTLPTPDLTFDDAGKDRKRDRRRGADGSNGPAQKKHRRLRWTKKKIMTIILIIILLPVLWFGYKFVHTVSKVFQGGVLSVLSNTKLKGEDIGRVNILLAGNSADDVGHDGAELTDSIMIISLNTKDNTAFMLSVPRDLWVDIPDYGHAKINEAYVDGEDEKFDQNGYFPGGMGLLQQVIQENFGITLNYYGLVNYNAFRDMVNAVGGINFTVHSTDKRGLYDPSIDYTTHGPLVKLTNGVHALNGQQALDLARARGDAYGSYGFPQSDFDRTTHQRQELLALRAKATSTGVLANPIKVSSLLDAVGNNVKTDFSLGEARRLASLSKSIPGSSIQSVSLNNVDGKNYLTSYTSPAGQSALIPATSLDDFSDIQSLLNRLMSSNPVVRENPSVAVLNATETSGLASKALTSLKAKGFESAGIGDATADQPKTTIIDLTVGAKPASKKLLQKLYPGATVTTSNPYAASYDADFIVILGQDQVPKPAPAQTSTGQ